MLSWLSSSVLTAPVVVITTLKHFVVPLCRPQCSTYYIVPSFWLSGLMMPSLIKYSPDYTTPKLKLSIVFYATGKTSPIFSQGPQEHTRPTPVWCSSLSHYQLVYRRLTAESSSCAQGSCALCRSVSQELILLQVTLWATQHFLQKLSMRSHLLSHPTITHNPLFFKTLMARFLSVSLNLVVQARKHFAPVFYMCLYLTTVPAQGWSAALW